MCAREFQALVSKVKRSLAHGAYRASRCKMSVVEADVVMVTLPSCKHSVRLPGEKWIFGLGGSRCSIQCNYYFRLTAEGGVRGNQNCRILKSITVFCYF